MIKDPTAEQKAVIEATQEKLVVAAAAGSGKTFVLVERYLKHITQDRLSPDQILTITFTRKAAAEMKRRIVDRLQQLGLAEQAQTAETGPIQTIHGFCERLLRENAIAASLDPEFEILSEAQGARLVEACVHHAFAYPPEDYPEALELIEQLAGKRQLWGSDSPHARLEAAVRTTLHRLRGTGLTPDELERTHLNPFALLSEWRRKLLADTPPEVLRHLDQTEGELTKRLLNAYKAAKKARPPYLAPSIQEDQISAAQTCGLMQLVCYAWRMIENAMQRDQTLDFVALEARAVELVSNSKPTRERIRSQYKLALVDEAQDLNPVQYRLLQAMGIEQDMLVGDVKQSIYGFRQADVKLFAERASEVAALELSKNWRSHDGVLAFVDTVFAAKWGDQYEPMLERKTIDLENPERAHFEDRVEAWIQPERDSELTARMVKDLVAEVAAAGGRAADIAVLVRKSSYAMDLLRRLEQHGVAARVSGGTERFYTRLEVRDLANALQAISDPYDDFALLALLRSPFVGLSLDALTLVARPEPTDGQDEVSAALPLVDRLKGFTSPVPEDGLKLERFLRWFEELRQYADRLPAWEAVAALLAKTDYLENLAKRQDGRRLIANVRKLLSLAAQEPDLGPPEYADRIREIQQIRHKEGDAPAEDEDVDAVTIMTVHKAKGLEFPVVVVPDTHEKLGGRSEDVEVDLWLPHPDEPGERDWMVAANFMNRPSMFHNWLAFRRRERDKEEEWRVMYVALTRAKERLCISLHPGGTRPRFSDEICRLLGFKHTPPPGLVVRNGLSDKPG
jgi:ATP-dependent helicase/nuclease subunit A